MFGFRYPFVILLAGAVAGTIMGRYLTLGLPVAAVVLIGAACFLLYGFLRLPAKFFILPLTLLVIAASFLNAGKIWQSFPADDVAQYAGNDTHMRFFGELSKWPLLRRHQTILVCRVDSVIIDNHVVAASGQILINLRHETTHFSLGDFVSFSGYPERPYSGGYPGQFDYARYLKDKGIRATVDIADPVYIMVMKHQTNIWGRGIASLRNWILECFQRNLTETSSALASGFLIGETHDIPDEVYQAFRRTGTMHLLAVSGSNVALVLVVIIVLMRFVRLRRGVKLVALLLVIVIFSHLSYNQPSVVRASIMAALILMARTFYRRTDMHNIIAAAAVILIFADPGNLYDIGFQLSFAVTWGLILFLPPINRLIEGRRLSKWSRYLLLIIFSSLIATLISAPITGYYFGEISLVTVFSNLIVVPLVSAAVIGIAILLLTGLVIPALAIVPGILLDRLLRIINDVVLWFDHWTIVTARIDSLPGYYVFIFLIGLVMFMMSIGSRPMRRLLIYYAAIAGVLILGVKLLLPSPAKGDVEIYNSGRSQSVIVNRGEGAAIFQQNGYIRRDAFTADFVPYLIRRGDIRPRYIVFTEPRYRVEQKLERLDAELPDIGLRPLSPDNGGDQASIWIFETDADDVSFDSLAVEFPSPGAIRIKAADSSSLLFFGNAASFANCPDKILEGADLYVLTVGEKGLSNPVADRIDPRRAVLLTTGSGGEEAGEGKNGTVFEARPVILPAASRTLYLEMPHIDKK